MSERLSSVFAKGQNAPPAMLFPKHRAGLSAGQQVVVESAVKLRIGFMNPWKDAAENQAFQSMAIAAERCGHELIHVSTSNEALAANLDFIIAVASTQPKLTSIPTFGCLHESRLRYWEEEGYFQNLLTYDGYFTISESLQHFVRCLCAGYRRRDVVGHYYNTPQMTDIETDFRRLVEEGNVAVAYFGTNWDGRSRPVFRLLAQKSYMSIYGPAKSWDYLASNAYKGQLAFDGQSVQQAYAACGIGLVMLSRGHAMDDVISNRIFEISAVGAVAVCPDIPWIRKHFGNSVFYYPAFAFADEIVREVDNVYDFVQANPEAAAEKGTQARAIFQKYFAAEVVLQNAVEYYKDWREHRASAIALLPTTLIDVVIRVGGRDLNCVSRAVESIDDQSSGTYRIIFVKYRDIDLDDLLFRPWNRVRDFKIVEELGGNRAQTLTAGLRNVTAPYFAVLDDDDFLLDNHFESLLGVMKGCSPGRAFGYAGMIEVLDGDERTALGSDRRRLLKLSAAWGNVTNVLGTFGMHTFLASSKLLEAINLTGWRLATAEDSALIGSLLNEAEVRFTYRATACVSVGRSDRSNFATTPTRPEDLLEALLRIGPDIELIERKFFRAQTNTWEVWGRALRDSLAARSLRISGSVGVLAIEESVRTLPLAEREHVQVIDIPLDMTRVNLSGDSHFSETAGRSTVDLQPIPEAWAYAAEVLVAELYHPGVTHLLAVFESMPGSYGIGLLNAAENDWQSRSECPPASSRLEIWLPVRDPADVGRVVIQNWAHAPTEPVRLLSLAFVVAG